MAREVRVRFAPSPTGYLHVGGARTALYNYLFARRAGGKFILRIEDTDLERSTEESMRMQIGDLKWLGLTWDEGPHHETLKDMGPHAPYRQSQRQQIYQEHAQKLLKSGKAYYCFLTDEEIEQQRQEATKTGRPPHVNSPYKNLPLAEAEKKIAAGEKAAVRFRVPEKVKTYSIQDLVRGEVTWPSDMVGDFVLIRSNGMPVYNFCCTIDDALMEITHVLRAEEHLSNTLRQLMIYEAFGWAVPEFGHMSIILGGDKQKLSKRHGATSCNEYRLGGYMPEAVNNFVALLGWSSPKAQEILSMAELIEQFSTERLHAAPAVFDEVKLKWVNATHLRALPHDELWKRVRPFLDEAGLKVPNDSAWLEKALSLFKTSMETLKDAVELFRPVAKGPLNILDESKETLSWPSTAPVIKTWRELVTSSGQDFLTSEKFEALQNQIKDQCQVKGKFLFMPVRVAVIGKPHGAELKELVPLIETATLVERAEQVLKTLGQ